MRGSDVIYPGPARLVLAAAGQLRDATLIERHAEEWLANLQGRTHLQQWRDSVSLLVRGARITRWIYDGTYGSRPRVVVVGQVMMALVMIAGTGFLFFFPSQLEIPINSFSVALYKDFGTSSFTASNSTLFCWQVTSSAADGYILTEPVMLALFLSLATASTLALTLVIRRSRRVISAGIAVSALVTYCVIYFLIYSEHSVFNVIICWWAVAGTLIVLLHRKMHPVIRVVAAVGLIGILRVSPLSWLPHEVSQLILGLTNFLRLLSMDLLGSVSFERIITFRVVLGMVFLLCGIFAWTVLRCAVVVHSLIRPARYDISGTLTCLQ